MRAKRIAAQVKAQGRAELWDVVDGEGVVRQWISTGVAAYPVDGMPYLKAANLDLRDCTAAEAIAQDQGLTIGVGGHEIVPVMARGQTYFVDMATLTPITAEHKSAELWLRESKEWCKYFAVKAGLLLAGIVLPMARQASVARALTLLGAAYHDDERGEADEEDEDEELEGQLDGEDCEAPA